jgi:hypothetical protein
VRARRPIPRRSKRKPLGKVPKAKLTNRAKGKRVTPKVWRRLLDRLCGLIVKERDGWACRNCKSTDRPQWAHYFSRRYHGLRWDVRNSCCLCARCHYYYTARPHEWEAWLQNKLGLQLYFELQGEAFKIAKPDYPAIWESLIAAALLAGVPRYVTDAARAEAARYGIAE